MGSLFIFFIFSLVLFASGLHVHARPNPPSPPVAKSNAASCHTPTKVIADDSAKWMPFVRDFEPILKASIYDDNAKLTKERSSADGKPFVKDFEPIPNLTVYGDNAKLTTHKSPTSGEPFVRDFEPTRNLSVYDDDAKLMAQKSSTLGELFVRDFESIPNATVYYNDIDVKAQTNIEHTNLKKKTIIGYFQA